MCGDKIFKRLFSGTLLLILSGFLFFGNVQNAFAIHTEGHGTGVGPANPPPVTSYGPGQSFPSGVGGGNSVGVVGIEGGRGTGAQGPIKPNDIAAAQANAAASQAEALATSENVGELDDPVLQFLHKYILTGIGSFVAYTGKAFDYAIEEYIIGFGNLYINKNVGEAIDSLWSTVRDIFNLTFIFGLVYIGFKMILDSSDSSARKMLVSLIGAALLVNFSLFITKFVVDFSNIAASQIYQAFGNTDALDFSITNGFMTMMGINRLIGVEMTASAGYAYIVGMLIVFAVLIYVFLAGAIMIIIRFVVLCIYMVFSPMMFLGWVFPAMKGHSEKYWKGFLNQAFFAPAFIFMLYLSYRVTYTFNYATKDWGHFFGQGVAKPIGVDGLIPFFAMVIIFLLASIMVAKNMGAVGASTVVSVGNNIRGRAQNALLAAPRYGARTLAGASASGLGKINDRLEGSRTGRNFKRALSLASLGTLDERNRRDLIKAGKNAKFGGSYSYDDDVKSFEEISATRSSEKTKAENKKRIKDGLAAQEPASTLTPVQKENAIAEMQSVVTSLTISQLEAMKDKDRTAIAGELSTQQTEALMKSEKIGADDKAAIMAKRKEVIEKLVGKTGAIITKELTKLSTDQLETMGDEFIRTNAHLLSHTQMDDLKKSKKFSEAQRERFTSTRKTYQKNAFLPNAFAGNVKSLFRHNDGTHRKAADIANLGSDVLLENTSQEFLTPDILEAIVDKKTLGSTDRQKLKTKIMTGSRTGPNADLQGWFLSPEGIHAWK